MLWLALALVTLVSALVLVLAVYPGELSWFSKGGTRWLYNRSAASYGLKWQRHDYQLYDELIAQAARAAAANTTRPNVLDLGCGSGRALGVAARTLGSAATYTAVDFSPEMLAQCRRRASALAQCDITLVEADIATWLRQQSAHYDLVLCMEVGEFLPEFGTVLKLLGQCCRAGAPLVMTRPAGRWHHFFPGRGQCRRQLQSALTAAGFVDTRFHPWRSRYECLSCRREGLANSVCSIPRESRSARPEPSSCSSQ